MTATFRFRCFVLLVLTLCLSFSAQAQLPRANPEALAMSGTRLAQMDQIIAESVGKHALPGAVVVVARKGRVVWSKAYGSRAVGTIPANSDLTFEVELLGIVK